MGGRQGAIYLALLWPKSAFNSLPRGFVAAT